MVDENHKLLKNNASVCEITVTLHFNLRLMLRSRENLLFNNIDHNMLLDICQLHCLTWIRKYRLETSYKGDNVNSSIKTSISKLLVFISRRKFTKFHRLFCFFLVLAGSQWLKKVWASPYNQKCPFCTLASKSNVTLIQALRLKILQSLHGNPCRVISASISILENKM